MDKVIEYIYAIMPNAVIRNIYLLSMLALLAAFISVIVIAIVRSPKELAKKRINRRIAYEKHIENEKEINKLTLELNKFSAQIKSISDEYNKKIEAIQNEENLISQGFDVMDEKDEQRRKTIASEIDSLNALMQKQTNGIFKSFMRAKAGETLLAINKKKDEEAAIAISKNTRDKERAERKKDADDKIEVLNAEMKEKLTPLIAKNAQKEIDISNIKRQDPLYQAQEKMTEKQKLKFAKKLSDQVEQDRKAEHKSIVLAEEEKLKKAKSKYAYELQRRKKAEKDLAMTYSTIKTIRGKRNALKRAKKFTKRVILNDDAQLSTNTEAAITDSGDNK